MQTGHHFRAVGVGKPRFAVTLTNVDFDGNRTEGSATTPGNGGVLHVTGTADVRISGGSQTNNFAALEGGALWNGGGTMIVDSVELTDNVASGPAADDGGGAIFNNATGGAGTVVITDSTIERNVADGAAGSGGGILNNDGGSIEVSGGSISDNQAVRAGGGIESRGGTETTLTDVTMESNVTGAVGAVPANPGNGGALHVTADGDVVVSGGVFATNVAAAEGGGLWNGSGTMTIDGAVIGDNVVTGGSADAGDAEAQGGGGIFNQAGMVVVTNTRMIGNRAEGAVSSGGGIFGNEGTTLQMMDSEMRGNTANRAGGGIEVRAGSTTTLHRVTLSQNTANTTGSGGGGNGGGLHVTGDGDVDISSSVIADNIAATEGGGLWNNTGRMNIAATAILNNVGQGADAADGGGGIFNNAGGGTGGTVVVSNSRIVGNRATGAAGSGGGILNNDGGTVDVIDSVIAGNTANRAGGGIELRSDSTATLTRVTLGGTASTFANDAGANPGNGGGLHITGTGAASVDDSTVGFNIGAEGGGLWNSPDGVLSVFNSTVSNNTARTSSGGGIHLEAGMATPTAVNALSFVTVALNSAAAGGGIMVEPGVSAAAESSLIAENSADDIAGDLGGSSTVTDVGDIDELRLYGGATATHRLRSGAAAIDAASAAVCEAAPIDASDQRGAGRSDACDAGAFERNDEPVINVVATTGGRIDVSGGPLDDVEVLGFTLVNGASRTVALQGISGVLLVNSEATDADLVGDLQVFVDADGDGAVDSGATPVGAGTLNGDNTFSVVFDDGAALDAGESRSYVVTADIGSIAAPLARASTVAGGILALGLLGPLPLVGWRRRMSWLAVLALLFMLGVGCGSDDVDSGGGDIEVGGLDGGAAIVNGDLQFLLTGIDGDDPVVIGRGLPINGPAIDQ